MWSKICTLDMGIPPSYYDHSGSWGRIPTMHRHAAPPDAPATPRNCLKTPWKCNLLTVIYCLYGISVTHVTHPLGLCLFCNSCTIFVERWIKNWTNEQTKIKGTIPFSALPVRWQLVLRNPTRLSMAKRNHCPGIWAQGINWNMMLATSLILL